MSETNIIKADAGANRVKNTGRRGGGPGRPENLRPPWKKGESGNPKGRPKGMVELDARVRALLAETLAEPSRFGEPGVMESRMRRILVRAAEQAEEGDAAARAWIFNRLCGRETQPLEVAGDGPTSVHVKITHIGAKVENGQK